MEIASNDPEQMNAPTNVAIKMNRNGKNCNPGNKNSRKQQQAGSTRSCAGCGGKIIDRFLLHALDRFWHTGCLKCSCCQALLADIGSSCFTKAGMILCKNDYIRLFGNTGACSSCGQSIPASELVMRAQGYVYHVKCFTCVSCHNQLVPGDRYNLINGNLFCEHDCHNFLKGNIHMAGMRTNHKVC